VKLLIAGLFVAGTLMVSGCGGPSCKEQGGVRVDDPPLWLPIHHPGVCTGGKYQTCTPGWTQWMWVPQSHCEFPA